MIHTPVARFCDLWNIATQNSPFKQKNAVCISTINSDGFPESRFVDLKDVSNGSFVFCSSLNSNKSTQLSVNPKVAMTVWWEHIGYQIRVLGNVKEVPNSTAEIYWRKRSKDAQIATTCFSQSKVIDSTEKILEQFKNTQRAFKHTSVPKPKNWGGYFISPISIEFLQFKENRLHLRELYQLKKGKWSITLLQP